MVKNLEVTLNIMPSRNYVKNRRLNKNLQRGETQKAMEKLNESSVRLWKCGMIQKNLNPRLIENRTKTIPQLL